MWIKNTIKNVLFFVLQKNSPIKELHKLFLRNHAWATRILICKLANVSGPNAVIVNIASQAWFVRNSLCICLIESWNTRLDDKLTIDHVHKICFNDKNDMKVVSQMWKRCKLRDTSSPLTHGVFQPFNTRHLHQMLRATGWSNLDWLVV